MSDADTWDILASAARKLKSEQEYKIGDTESDTPTSKWNEITERQEATTLISSFRVVKNRKTVHQETEIETQGPSGKTEEFEALKEK